MNPVRGYNIMKYHSRMKSKLQSEVFMNVTTVRMLEASYL